MVEKLEYANDRLVRALKLLLYFSVVLPAAFMNYYEDDPVYDFVVFHNEDYLKKYRTGKKAAAYLQKFKEDPEWQKDKIQEIESNVEEKFMELLENRFIDHVYSGNRTVVTKEEFLDAIAGKDSLMGSIDVTK